MRICRRMTGALSFLCHIVKQKLVVNKNSGMIVVGGNTEIRPRSVIFLRCIPESEMYHITRAQSGSASVTIAPSVEATDHLLAATNVSSGVCSVEKTSVSSSLIDKSSSVEEEASSTSSIIMGCTSSM